MGNRTLLVVQSILAGMQVIAASTALINLVPEKYAAFFAVLVAAVQVGVATWTHGLHTTPASTPIVIAQRGTPITIEATETTASGDTRTTQMNETRDGQ